MRGRRVPRRPFAAHRRRAPRYLQDISQIGELPLLVIVSGPPGAGKTTLAAHLARELRLPLVSRDALKEPLMDALGARDREASRRIGRASYAVLYAMAGALLDGGVSFVLESNFRPLALPELERLTARSRAALVHCDMPVDLILRRYAARAATRHPGHHDDREEVRRDVARGQFALLDLRIPTLRVDTTDGYRPPLEEILGFVLRSARDS